MDRRFIIVATLALLAPLCAAESVVWFTDGRSMRVVTAQVEDNMLLVTLSSGIEMAIPEARVERIGTVPRTQQASPKSEPTQGRAALRSGLAWRQRAGQFANLIDNTADRHNLDPVLLTAMAQVESAWDPQATNYGRARFGLPFTDPRA